MATHSSVLAWRIPGTGDPGGLLSMGSHRVGHDWSNLAASREQTEHDLTVDVTFAHWGGVCQVFHMKVTLIFPLPYDSVIISLEGNHYVQ